MDDQIGVLQCGIEIFYGGNVVYCMCIDEGQCFWLLWMVELGDEVFQCYFCFDVVDMVECFYLVEVLV